MRRTHWFAVASGGGAGMLAPMVVHARGGGGGSSSGGGGGGFGGGSGGSGGGELFVWAIILVVAAVVAFFAKRKHQQRVARAQAALRVAAQTDTAWNEDALRTRVAEVFPLFQSAWSTLEVGALAPLLTESFRKRIVLELAVLKAEGRRNIMERPHMLAMEFLQVTDAPGTHEDRVLVRLHAQANDTLRDVVRKVTLFTDADPFVEYWTFAREDGTWQLDRIQQATEAPSLRERTLQEFSDRHGFFYDPDFGWLMMPNQGVLFRKSNFQTSDINNHVIGYYRDRVIELYTYIPRPQRRRGTDRGWVIAQAILPKRYHDILVERRRWWHALIAHRGVRRIPLGNVDLDRKFSVWASPLDQANAFELLTPTFLERIHALPFPVTMEVVDHFLYLATRHRSSAAQYEEMLEVLSWAFDEMQR
ncbi:hypothetical protein HY632_00850 [Candidatus Uhrbacteria bacterium]|nr:hypothetical protein [Candidatus Uhrbacteria bacterium]